MPHALTEDDGERSAHSAGIETLVVIPAGAAARARPPCKAAAGAAVDIVEHEETEDERGGGRVRACLSCVTGARRVTLRASAPARRSELVEPLRAPIGEALFDGIPAFSAAASLSACNRCCSSAASASRCSASRCVRKLPSAAMRLSASVSLYLSQHM